MYKRFRTTQIHLTKWEDRMDNVQKVMWIYEKQPRHQRIKQKSPWKHFRRNVHILFLSKSITMNTVQVLLTSNTLQPTMY
jgi:hypothetical protein